MSKSSALLTAAAAATIIVGTSTTTTSAFTVPSTPSALHYASVARQTPVASSSPLFRASYKNAGDQQSPSSFSSSPLALFMTDGNDAEEEIKDAEIVDSSSASSSSSSLEKKADDGDDIDQGGFFMTLLLAPPLIFKFCIVLIVKFMTDAVVYPTIFLWRVAGRAKRKVLGVFGIKTDDNGKDEGPINGEGAGAGGDFA